MPSPIGHALGGIALAWWATPRRNRYAALVLAAVALAPDLDLLVGDHRGISHSIGAAGVAGLIACAAAALRNRGQTGVRPLARGTEIPARSKGVSADSDPFFAARWGAAVMLAWGSHVFLDWLSNDTRPPLGVMGLWPITSDYFKSSIEIFPAVSRQCCGRRFWLYNLRALIVEGLILAPLILLALRSLKRK